jgi:hypothetical protein
MRQVIAVIAAATTIAAVALATLGCSEAASAIDGMVATDAAIDAGIPDAQFAAPSAQDISFTGFSQLPQGQWILVTDWRRSPQTLLAISPTSPAATPRSIFGVNRFWSFATEADGARMLFAAWDELQTEHYGITMLHSIENTFLYERASQSMRAIAWGNINDECHAFSPDGQFAYVCRRYDFVPAGGSDGPRIGRIYLDSGYFEFLRPEQDESVELYPQPLPGGQHLLFGLRYFDINQPGAIVRRDLGNGAETLVMASAGRPVLAPDGHRMLYQSEVDDLFYVFDLNTPTIAPFRLSTTAGIDSAWSPDGSAIIYSVFEPSGSCTHLDRVTLVGSTPTSPVRIRDCLVTGEFYGNLAWITVP